MKIREVHQNDTDLLSAALSYAAQGLRVLPLHSPERGGCSCGRSACASIGKHARIPRWSLDATTDDRQIRRWWAKWPDANIGIATGPGSGIFVLDIDGEHGAESFRRLVERSAWHIETLTVRTGRGRHLYLAHPGVKVITRSNIAPGVDVRGDGGLVVAPPSRHASGFEYSLGSATRTIADAPSELLDLVTTDRRVCEEGGLGVAPIEVGERNERLFREACAMRGRGMDEGEIAKEIAALNAMVCDEPLSHEELAAIARSAAKYDQGANTDDADETELFFVRLKVSDWLSDGRIVLMDDRQRGWYMDLYCHAWKTGGYLPSDPAKLYKLARASCSLSKFRSNLGPIYAFLEADDDDMLLHRELRAFWVKSKRDNFNRKKAGRASAEKRKKAAEEDAA
jgi:uncharacterized protein YdaU (DUF1376 family)